MCQQSHANIMHSHSPKHDLLKNHLIQGWNAMVQLWCVMALIQLALHTFNPHSVWNSAIPFGLRLRFLCTEFHYASILSIGLAIVVVLLPPKPFPVGKWLTVVLSFIYACFLVISWGQSILTSRFLSLESLKMLLHDPKGLYLHSLHMHPIPTVLAPVAIAGATFILFISLSRIRPNHILIRKIASAVMVLTMAFSYWNALPLSLLPFENPIPYDDPQAGKVSSIGDHLTHLFLHNTGPHVAITGSYKLRNRDQMEIISEHPVLWKPQINLESYVSPADTDTMKHYNVMLILVESLREGIVEPRSDPNAIMPNLNEMAAQSLVFSRHYATASHSNYSDLSPLSSHFPLRGKDTHIYPANPSYPRVLIYDILKQFGYRTSIVSSQNEHWGKMINYLKTSGLDDLLHSENFDGEVREDLDKDALFWKNRRSGKVDDFHTINRLLDWINEDSPKPFFCYVNLQNSHFPFETGPGFERRFGKENLTFVPTFPYGSPDQVPDLYGRYLDSLAYIDLQLGRLFQWMKETGLMDNTVIIITGDTGQSFMEHGVLGHANKLFDEVVRTPLLIKSPGIQHRIDPRLAQNVDIPPTVLGILGLPPHPSFQGIDLIQTPVDSNRSVYIVVQTPLAKEYAMVKGDWKIVVQPFPREYRLYNMQDDPDEIRNLAQEKPDVLERLKPELLAWYHYQVQYYENPRLHQAFYPPVLVESEPIAQDQ